MTTEQRRREFFERIIKKHNDRPQSSDETLPSPSQLFYELAKIECGIDLEPEKAVTDQSAYSPDEPPPETEQWMYVDNTFRKACIRVRVTPIADAQGRPYKREKP